ncbi:MAG: beta-N-acetylhexosaminidase [Rhodovibrionaceae bacterium]|nr:beta-N-acetylhexosaminidase [Rhodovibrionaceae bacterium]
MPPRAVILGCAGTRLSAEEARFFADNDPFGFILFARNVDSPAQLRALTNSLRQAVGRAEAPVLIDQEGGRVARLRAPRWREAPAAEIFGRLYRHDPDGACEAVRLNALLLAAELQECGIDVDCAPVLDLRRPEGHEVIGDRAFSDEVDAVVALGGAMAEGLMQGGVTPVGKHVPGHGRAPVDSHLELPRVRDSHATLADSDFRCFQALNGLPWMMTAHVVYEALDKTRPATTSPAVIAEVIRGEIGFDGVLVSDDLSMQALSGDFERRTADALEAGCDLALHCNGEMEEMRAVCRAAPSLSADASRRIETGRARVAAAQKSNGDEAGRTGPETVDQAEIQQRLDALLQAA